MRVAAVLLLQEVDQEFPGVLPELAGLPELAHVDPMLVAVTACAGAMVAMVSFRARCSAHAFHPDHLERSTFAFMASLLTRPATGDGDPALRRRAPWEQGRSGGEAASGVAQPTPQPLQVSAALSAARCAAVCTCVPYRYTCHTHMES